MRKVTGFIVRRVIETSTPWKEHLVKIVAERDSNITTKLMIVGLLIRRTIKGATTTPRIEITGESGSTIKMRKAHMFKGGVIQSRNICHTTAGPGIVDSTATLIEGRYLPLSRCHTSVGQLRHSKQLGTLIEDT